MITGLVLALLLLFGLTRVQSEQQPLLSSSRLVVSEGWNALGPWPIGTRGAYQLKS